MAYVGADAGMEQKTAVDAMVRAIEGADKA